MSSQGLQNHRNRMVTIETEWQTALCFAQGCFHILGLFFYFSQSSNAKSLSGLNLFQLAPTIWEIVSTFANSHLMWVA